MEGSIFNSFFMGGFEWSTHKDRNGRRLDLIASTRHDEFAEADCWLAAENLMLTAFDLGLGTCPVGNAISCLNSEMVKAELGIPADMAAIAPIIVGYPGGPPSPPAPRAAPRILSFRR